MQQDLSRKRIPGNQRNVLHEEMFFNSLARSSTVTRRLRADVGFLVFHSCERLVVAQHAALYVQPAASSFKENGRSSAH